MGEEIVAEEDRELVRNELNWLGNLLRNKYNKRSIPMKKRLSIPMIRRYLREMIEVSF